MIDLDEHVKRALDAAAPPRRSASTDWDEIVRASSRRRARFALPAGALAAAVVAAVLALSWPFGGSHVAVLQRALAAVGTEPVIHVAVEGTMVSSTLVNLATGETRTRTSGNEYWYDAERHLLRARMLIDGKKLTEIVETPHGTFSDLSARDLGANPAAQLDPALAGFVTHYREALADGTAKVIGDATIEGQDVTVLRLTLDRGVLEEVAVDGDYRPRFFRQQHLVGARPDQSPILGWSPWADVTTAESIPRDPEIFAKPELAPPRPTAARDFKHSEATLAQIAEALDGRALWLGDRFEGLRITATGLSSLHVTMTDDSEADGTVASFTYGTSAHDRHDDSRPSVDISEAPTQAGAYGIGMEDGGDVLPPKGWIAVSEPAPMLTSRPGDPRMVSGKLRTDGVYVSIETSSRELLLAAARGLHPIRSGTR